MTVFDSSNISGFENQQFVGFEGEVLTLKELCSKANLRILFNHSRSLGPDTLTLIDNDCDFPNIIFRRRNYENATRDVLRYVNDKLNNNSVISVEKGQKLWSKPYVRKKSTKTIINELTKERDKLFLMADKLEDLLGRYESVADVQYTLMECQLKHMRCYGDILDKRILDLQGLPF